MRFVHFHVSFLRFSSDIARKAIPALFPLAEIHAIHLPVSLQALNKISRPNFGLEIGKSD
jgi:hypothetical protein